MRIVLSTGWASLSNYWGQWFTSPQIGGSEHMVLNLAREFARRGHQVTLRVPFDPDRSSWAGVRVVGHNSAGVDADLGFFFDQYADFDRTERRALVVTRSDPPQHRDFQVRIYYSRFHASLFGDDDGVPIGGGVDLEDYRTPFPRVPRRVICCTSPDRCLAAAAIGRAFDFRHTYRPVPGFHTVEVSRQDLVRIQQTAQVMIHPLDPVRPSEMFGMALLEAMAAGTPVVTTDADAMSELWHDCAVVLPLPIDLGLWNDTVEELLANRTLWKRHSLLGQKVAANYTWERQATRFLEAAS